MIVAAMNRAFSAHSLALLPREKVLSIVGLSLEEAIRKLLPEEDAATVSLVKESYRQAFFHLREDPALHEPLFPGARQALDALAARDDVLLGVATGKSQRGLRNILELHDIRGHFMTLQTADEHPSKPHPSMMHQAMSDAGVDAAQTVIFGDTSYDIVMGRDAGAHTVGRRVMRKLLFTLLLLVVALVGALYGLTFLDINAYRAEIAALAEEQTGRKLELDGPLNVGFSLTPTIVARDVRFGNASWGSDPTMFAADRVALRLSLISLLAGSVDVTRLDVRGAKVLLETGPGGVGNWVMTEADAHAAPSDSDGQVTTASLPRVVLEDVQVTYKSGRRGDATDVVLTRADIEPRPGGIAVGLVGDVNAVTASASALIVGDESSFRVDDLNLAYGEIGLTGHLIGSRRSANAPITIDGELSASAIDLNALGSGSGGSDGQQGLFSKSPLPFNALSALNGEIDVKVDSLTYRNAEFTDLQTAVTLKDGSLSAPIFATYESRRLEAEVSARNSATPTAGIVLSAPGFNIGTFLEEMDATDLLNVDGHIGLDLSARGKSPAELASSLNGKIDVATGRGTIHSSAFEWIAKDLIWALIPKGGESGTADLTCFIGHIDFTGGIGNVSSLALVTSEIRTSGSGTVNLRNETVDMQLKPRPNDPGLLSLATPINVSGPLASPSVLPDTGALLGDLALAVGAGALTGGIGALLPLVSAEHFDAEEASACVEMIAAERGSGSRAGGNGNVLDKAGEGASTIIEGVGDILTSPFN
eukprot:s1_g30.t1